MDSFPSATNRISILGPTGHPQCKSRPRSPLRRRVHPINDGDVHACDPRSGRTSCRNSIDQDQTRSLSHGLIDMAVEKCCLRPNAMSIVLRSPWLDALVRARYHGVRGLFVWNVSQRRANWICRRRTRTLAGSGQFRGVMAPYPHRRRPIFARFNGHSG